MEFWQIYNNSYQFTLGKEAELMDKGEVDMEMQDAYGDA